ncbi:MAG: class I SAM-dependent methyltransferase [Clostridiaceae bacterium]|nr:class I SAM-dependent methyltransferase [Clostridiaceae bacterium]
MNEGKFDGKGNIYAKFRPTYPREFIEYLFVKAQINEQSVIADIGSGTGILTGQLLEKGTRVFAVEPNSDMRRVAEENFRKNLLFTSAAASAEHTTLPERSVDLITVAQAFHWFDRDAFREECRRILKQGAYAALVWNSRDENSALVAENDRINRKYCPAFKGFSGGTRGPAADDDFHDFFTGGHEKKIFPNNLLFDQSGFIGRNLSASYSLKEEDEQYGAYVTDLEALFEKHAVNGTVTMPNFTQSFTGRV